MEVPDGVYRLILLTDNLGNTTAVNPLGQAIVVNGVRTPMAGGAPDSWQGNGRLTGGGVQTASGGPIGTQTGGATVIYVEVVNGRLLIEFLPEENQNIFITGLILEPAEGPSVLDIEDIFDDDDEILFARSIINDAIGQTLEKIATAAGDESVREEILNLDEPLTEQQDAVSPS